MSKKDEEVLLVGELRKRIDNLKIVDKSGPFFRETARLASWMGEVSLFEQPLLALDLQSKKRDKETLETLKEIHKEGEKIWLAIKKIPIPLNKNKTPEMVQHSLASLIQYYDMPHPQYGIGIYHSLRYVVEHLALGTNSKKVEKFVDRNNDVKYPNLKGKIYELFIKYNKKQDLTKKELATSLWGAWDNLKYVDYLAGIDNDYPQLEDWAKVFAKDEYFVHLYKVSDYLFDWLVLNKKGDKLNVDPLLESVVWDKKFKFENDYAKFGQYGEVRFYPERSPSRLDGDKKLSPKQLFLQKLFEVGETGINREDLSKHMGIRENDLKAYINSTNDVFQNNYKNQKINARVYVSIDSEIIRLAVIPVEGGPISKPEA
jgi:hypothetical protein